MTDLKALRSKLEALRRMTVENGCTEAEAATAADKMAEILAKHGLSEADLDAMAMTDHRAQVRKQRSPIDEIWGAVADFARCVRWSEARRVGKRHIVYFGREADVMVAEYVHDVIARAVDDARSAFRASSDYRRRRLARTRAAALRAFEEGVALRIMNRLWVGLWRRHGGDQAEFVKGLVRQREQLYAVVGQDTPLKEQRPIGRAGGRYDQARWAGMRAGDAMVVEAGVGTTTAPVAGLLP
jgi:hypothetical protein